VPVAGDGGVGGELDGTGAFTTDVGQERERVTGADLVLTFECAADAAFGQEVVQVPLEVVTLDASVGQWQRQRQGSCADAVRVQGGGVIAQAQPAVAELFEFAESLSA
jgi:hypothetical protein